MPLSDLLDLSPVYRLWQAPFVGSKVEPFLRHHPPERFGRVLEVGCGPGTNAPLFIHNDYLGLDLNPRYIDAARRRFGSRFEVADARTLDPAIHGRFDTIFMNSLLHHLDDEAVRNLLRRLANTLSDTGSIHILDLVLPGRTCIARWLAEHDRGDFARPLDEWRQILSESFRETVFEPYALRRAGVDLWQMVYFKGIPV